MNLYNSCGQARSFQGSDANNTKIQRKIAQIAGPRFSAIPVELVSAEVIDGLDMARKYPN
jgi:hypothetical protein